MHIARELCGGQICVTPDAAAFAAPETGPWLEKFYTINERWVAEDRRRLLAFARDLLNSDYAGHRLTFQLFAQSPPFANLAAVYRNFDWAGPLRHRASAPPGLSRARRSSNDAEVDDARRTPPHPALQHEGHLSRAAARQRPLPGGGRRQHGLSARPGGAGSRHARERRASATRRRRPSRRWTTSSCCSSECGATLDDICKCIVYLTDIRYREPVYRVLGERLRGVFPVFTGLVVRRARAAGVGGRGRRDRGAAVTFSLAARCAASGRFGIVVLVVEPGRRRALRPCARRRRARRRRRTSPTRRSGRALLDLLAERPAGARGDGAARRDAPPHAEFRQLTLRRRRRARRPSYSGERTLGRHATAEGVGCVAAGNLLADEGVPEAMVDAFEDAAGDDLGDRLVAALIGRARRRRRGGAGALGRPAGRRRRRLAGRRPARRLARRADRTSSRGCGRSGSRSSTPTSRARSTRRRRRATACPATSSHAGTIRSRRQTRRGTHGDHGDRVSRAVRRSTIRTGRSTG